MNSKGRMQLESKKVGTVRSGANEVSPLSLLTFLSGLLHRHLKGVPKPS